MHFYSLKGAQRNTDVWQRILKVRSLVVTSKEDMDMWIKFANLCRKSGRLSLAQKTLLTLASPSQAALATTPDLPVDFDISVRFYSYSCMETNIYAEKLACNARASDLWVHEIHVGCRR